jgi:hypothetical protein
MSLDLEKPGRRARQVFEVEEMMLKSDELQGWLQDLETWVETQLEATDALVKKTINGGTSEKGRITRKSGTRVA